MKEHYMRVSYKSDPQDVISGITIHMEQGIDYKLQAFGNDAIALMNVCICKAKVQLFEKQILLDYDPCYSEKLSANAKRYCIYIILKARNCKNSKAGGL